MDVLVRLAALAGRQQLVPRGFTNTNESILVEKRCTFLRCLNIVFGGRTDFSESNWSKAREQRKAEDYDVIIRSSPFCHQKSEKRTYKAMLYEPTTMATRPVSHQSTVLFAIH
jgi:hypothetical protein